MSDCKCEHNNHSHFLIWMFIWCSLFMPSCVDCSGERQRMKNDISTLESKVRALESAEFQRKLNGK